MAFPLLALRTMVVVKVRPRNCRKAAVPTTEE